jgi:hypothetical protein
MGCTHKHVVLLGEGRGNETVYQLILILLILTANEFLSGGSGTTIRHNTQIIQTTQNNTPC